MQKRTNNTPNNKLTVFKELVSNLDFKVDKSLPQYVLTTEQIELVNQERKQIKDDPDHFQDWKEARNLFKTS